MSKSERTCGFTNGRGKAEDGQSADGSASPETKSTTRRNLLQMGAGLAAVTGLSRDFVAPAIARDTINVPKAPNIIVLMTDQERHHRHWPEGWTEKNLPSLQRLKRHGLYLQRAYMRSCLIQTGPKTPAAPPLISRQPRSVEREAVRLHRGRPPSPAPAHRDLDVARVIFSASSFGKQGRVPACFRSYWPDQRIVVAGFETRTCSAHG
jgi:hypothetical protein